ncbi:myogenesis-regulating glycosidase-like isoform X2 [Centruroides vittatus]|uniref:myogenesis-regulating glycosidase-like isoform X2 n=1 Tax=Centruroides vittatus TaxID=120091 RepID=UPI00351097D2
MDDQSKIEVEKNEDEKEKKDSKMDLRTNASTDDLLSLEGGIQSPESTPVQQVSNNTQTTESPSSNLQQLPLTPNPSIRRKSHYPSDSLRLDLDETTWKPQIQSRQAVKDRLRLNLQAKAAKVSAVVQRGRSPEFRFRIILLLLFASIISLVTFTWYMYQQQRHILEFGDNINFNDMKRLIKLLKKDKRDLLEVQLGLGIPKTLGPYDCRILFPNNTLKVCEEWKYRARMKISRPTHVDEFSCYEVQWESLSKETVLKDCVNLGDATWYGMGELHQISWPFSRISIDSKPFVTGDIYKDEFGSILERYWLSSDGVAIKVKPNIPLYISLKDNDTKQLCLEAKLGGFPYRLNETAFPKLEYTMCTGLDIKSLHEYMIRVFYTLPTNLTSIKFLEAPIWTTGPHLGPTLNEDSVQKFANHIREIGLDAGFLIIDSRWQREEGDLEFQNDTFPNPHDLISILHNKGFKVLLTVQPYTSLASKQFQNGTDNSYFISDKELNVPLLTRWNKKVCAILDITNDASAQWMLSKLETIRNDLEVDGFFFTGGQSTFLPRSYNFTKSTEDNINPDISLSSFVNLISNTSPLIGLSVGFESQNIPAFISLSPRTPTWDNQTGLQSIIPSVLTLGLLGYPLVNPGSVGGDLLHVINDTKPENELYIRWIQLTAFMPVIQFSIAPTRYSLDVIKISKALVLLRKERILPIMSAALEEYMMTGAPIIRPLWWMAPNDPNAHKVGNQFAVGNKIVVAPILEKGKQARDIYLPPGMWRDEVLGETRRGGKWIHNYTVLIDKIAYFTKTTDENTVKMEI